MLSAAEGGEANVVLFSARILRQSQKVKGNYFGRDCTDNRALLVAHAELTAKQVNYMAV